MAAVMSAVFRLTFPFRVGAASALSSALVISRTYARPRSQSSGGAEDAHINSDLGNDVGSNELVYAGDAGQQANLTE